MLYSKCSQITLKTNVYMSIDNIYNILMGRYEHVIYQKRSLSHIKQHKRRLVCKYSQTYREMGQLKLSLLK